MLTLFVSLLNFLKISKMQIFKGCTYNVTIEKQFS